MHWLEGPLTEGFGYEDNVWIPRNLYALKTKLVDSIGPPNNPQLKQYITNVFPFPLWSYIVDGGPGLAV